MSLKIAINGFGRIGRAVTRAILNRNDISLVAINDANVSTIKNIDYILKYDSIFRKLENRIYIENDYLIVDNHKIKLFNKLNPKDLNFADFGAEVVLECCGVHLTKKLSSSHLKNGAKKVIYSAPAMDDTPTYVLGVNANNYQNEDIISNGSCTTNCLGPIAKIIDENFGIKKGVVTTIHSYTNDQNILDENHIRDKRKARAAAVNMIPTTTGAAKAMKLVMPSLKDKLHGQSVRVPTPNVSMVDFNVLISKESSKEEINLLFEKYAQNELKGILAVDNEMMVSSDIVGNSNSSIVATDLTQVIDKDLVKIMSWYDNEWGYSNRLIDMAKFIMNR